MSVEVLGTTVDGDIGAQGQGLLEVRRAEGVVDDDDGSVGMSDGDDGGDVDDTKSGIGGGLNPDETGVGTKSLLEVVRIRGQVDKASVDTEVSGDLGEEPVGAAVHVVHGDDVAVTGQSVEDGGGGSGTRAKGQTVLGTLETGDGLLKGLTRWVSRAGVVKTGVDTDGGLTEGGGEGKGWDDGTGAGVGGLTSVDGKRPKLGVVISRVVRGKGLDLGGDGDIGEFLLGENGIVGGHCVKVCVG